MSVSRHLLAVLCCCDLVALLANLTGSCDMCYLTVVLLTSVIFYHSCTFLFWNIGTFCSACVFHTSFFYFIIGIFLSFLFQIGLHKPHLHYAIFLRSQSQENHKSHLHCCDYISPANAISFSFNMDISSKVAQSQHSSHLHYAIFLRLRLRFQIAAII